jgi:hypothetical protein
MSRTAVATGECAPGGGEHRPAGYVPRHRTDRSPGAGEVVELPPGLRLGAKTRISRGRDVTVAGLRESGDSS